MTWIEHEYTLIACMMIGIMCIVTLFWCSDEEYERQADIEMLKKYFKNVLIGIDQLINAICKGDPDETISSRVGKARDKNEVWWAKIINKIFFWQKNHCQESIEEDEGKDAL